MYKKIIAILIAISFAGCASNGIATNTMGKQKVVKVFKIGKIVTQKKVLVSKSLTSTVTGATLGAVAGGVSQKNVKGTAIGAVAGGVIGYVGGLFLNNNEVESYETTIRSENKIYTAYLEIKLPKNTNVEFVERDGKITNVGILR